MAALAQQHAQAVPPPEMGGFMVHTGPCSTSPSRVHLEDLPASSDTDEPSSLALQKFASLVKDEGQDELEALQMREEIIEELSRSYQLGTFLGSGNSAEVFMAYDVRDLKTVALKIIEVSQDDDEMRNVVQREIYYAKININNEGLVRTEVAFNIVDHFFVVMEFMSGGSLEELLRDSGRLPEAAAKLVMRSLIRGLEHLHSHDLVHRDVKPANIMFPFRGALDAKVSDFGLCEVLRLDERGKKRLSGMYGTPYYVAPEIVRNSKYDDRVDLWSCGVILYEMLSGDRPFEGETTIDVLKKVRKGSFRFSAPVWKYVSSDAKKLISKLLCVDYKRRLRAEEALQQRWFGGEGESARLTENRRMSHSEPKLTIAAGTLLC